MAGDYVKVYMRLADQRMRKVEQCVESSRRTFTSKEPSLG